MRTRLEKGRAMRSWLRCRTVATPSLGLFALPITLLVTAVAAVPASAAQVQAVAKPNAAHHANVAQPGVKAALVEVPTGELSKSGLLSTLPVSDLGVSEGELSKLLAGLAGGALTGKEATLAGLLSGLLGEKSSATLEELVSKIKANPVLGTLLTLTGKHLTVEEILDSLSPQALDDLVSHLTEGATTAQVQQLLAGLAGNVPSGEETAALHTIVETLTSSLTAEELATLRSDLQALPTGLSKGELETLSPTQLAEVIDGLFASATPTQLAPVVDDLLGTVKLGAGTTQSLAEGLKVPVQSLASALGEAGKEGFSSLPVNTGELGTTGDVVGLVDRTKGLALGLLGPEGKEGEGEGGSGSGGSGSGGNGGSSGSGGSGSGGNGGSPGSGGSGSGSGGSGGSGPGGSGGSGGQGGGTSGGLTVTVTLPATPGAGASVTSHGATKSTPPIVLLSHSVHGHTAKLVLKAPSAGTLVLSGRGVKTTSKKVSKGGHVTLTTLLSRAGIASLRHAHHGLRVQLKAVFKPAKGSSSSATVTVTFA
jgi:hypothetical protein